MCNIMTKVEAFEAIKAIVAENEELVAFVDKELELLAKRKDASAKARAKKAEENNGLADNVVAVVENAEEKLSTMDIAQAVGVSTQKVTPILAKLVTDGRLDVVTEKRKKYYSVAEDNTAEDNAE